MPRFVVGIDHGHIRLRAEFTRPEFNAGTLHGDATLIAGVSALGERPGVAAALNLPARVKRDDVTPRPAHIFQWRGETRGAFVTIDGGGDADCSVDGIVFPIFSPSSGEAETAEIHGRDAFLKIVSLLGDGLPSAESGSRLAAWADGVPCFQITFNDAHSGAAALDALARS